MNRCANKCTRAATSFRQIILSSSDRILSSRSSSFLKPNSLLLCNLCTSLLQSFSSRRLYSYHSIISIRLENNLIGTPVPVQRHILLLAVLIIHERMKLPRKMILAFCTTLLNAISAAATFNPARPPAIPLAVKSPYMNVVLPAGCVNGGNLPGQWPTFWA
jgi:hypothetical protein